MAHPRPRCFAEALDLHLAGHAMEEEDFAAALGQLLDTEMEVIGEGLRALMRALAHTPICLVETVFIAGVLYGRDTTAQGH